MEDISKIEDVILESVEALSSGGTAADRERAFEKIEGRLDKLGALSISVHSDEDQYDAIAGVVAFAQKHSNHVLYQGPGRGESANETAHRVFAIPREIAEKIVVLGIIPE